jgi:hypothetical protein
VGLARKGANQIMSCVIRNAQQVPGELSFKFTYNIHDNGRILIVILSNESMSEDVARDELERVAKKICNEIFQYSQPFQYDWEMATQNSQYKFTFSKNGQAVYAQGA